MTDMDTNGLHLNIQPPRWSISCVSGADFGGQPIPFLATCRDFPVVIMFHSHTNVSTSK